VDASGWLSKAGVTGFGIRIHDGMIAPETSDICRAEPLGRRLFFLRAWQSGGAVPGKPA